MNISENAKDFISYNQELLVNIHSDFPEAGIQVPSGIVEVFKKNKTIYIL
jgi:small-conductance mechanosensitive channel